MQPDAAFYSPRGRGEKTRTLEEALEDIGMEKEDRIELIKLINPG